MPDDLAQQVAEAVARVRARPTARVPDVALLLDRSPHRIYEDLRLRGHVAGVPAVRTSEKCIRVQSLGLLHLLGLDLDDHEPTTEEHQ